MRFSLKEMERLLELKTLSLEDEIKFNILNYIHAIQLNGYDFINSSCGSEYFGEPPMKFIKNGGQAMGLITVGLESGVRRYIFNDRGYELLEDITGLEEK